MSKHHFFNKANSQKIYWFVYVGLYKVDITGTFFLVTIFFLNWITITFSTIIFFPFFIAILCSCTSTTWSRTLVNVPTRPYASFCKFTQCGVFARKQCECFTYTFILYFMNKIDLKTFNNTWAGVDVAFCLARWFTFTWFATEKLLKLFSIFHLDSSSTCTWASSDYPITPCTIN